MFVVSDFFRIFAKKKNNLVMDKICTTIEQSERLIELGIDVKTADMLADVASRFGWPYQEYKEEDFGCHYYEEEY